MGRLCQASIRRTPGRAGLSVALHPPRCHRQQPADRLRSRRRHLPMEGLSRRRARQKVMTLVTGEFIRRFLIHVLPKGLHRIRHYGLLARGTCADNVARVRELLAVKDRENEPTETVGNTDKPSCPCCGGRMIVIEVFERGATPRHRPTAPASAIRIDTS